VAHQPSNRRPGIVLKRDPTTRAAEALWKRLTLAAQNLSTELRDFKCDAPVTHVYNPLDYAWAAHEAYLRKFGNSAKQVVFLGMNPGPFGMVQTGVPFGEIAAVRDWMQIDQPIHRPSFEHPCRPIQGFGCTRSEISGLRLWGLFAERFGRAEEFFRQHFVANYCPLAFLESSGRNRTPDKLPALETSRLYAACDRHLREVVDILQPEWLIGVGAFAEARAKAALSGRQVRIGRILHPSPASPASNRNWPLLVTTQLKALGVWA
jgi:single-strand selective monofunctional uracil DNA glycosylase